MTLDRFWRLLRELPAPSDAEALYATDAAGSLRSENLRRYLDLMIARDADTVLVGEAPGWRGMTVTGVPFVSLRELDERPGLFTREPDGDGFERPVDAAAPWEASSRVVSAVIRAWMGRPFLSWPIYPHHPHEPGDVRTNRTPRPDEVRAGVRITLELLGALGPVTVLAVGRKAEAALAKAGIEATAVRHPAQGGATLFTEQLLAYDRSRAAGAVR